jgi:hypothetical protein
MAAASPGIEPEQICQTVGIESTQLSDPCSRVPITQLVAAFETAAKLTHSDCTSERGRSSVLLDSWAISS